MNEIKNMMNDMASTRGVDLTPTKKGYLRMLLHIISESTNRADIEWSKNEIMKMMEE